METSDWYRNFASHEAAGSSPSYERIATAIAGEPELIDLIDQLPAPKRQPNLLLASSRYLGAPTDDASATLDFIRARWDEVRDVVERRSTQTNEPARTASFLPLLSTFDQPIALIEVGASAGLCLYPDRYRIRYEPGATFGPPDSPVRIDVATNGRIPEARRPLEIVWRAGLDLQPLDAGDAEDSAWLAACIWPEHTDRHDRLQSALTVAAADPPDLFRGDLVDDIDDVLDAAPDAATTVVFHSAVLAYLRPERRAAFSERVLHRDTIWLSNEAPGVIDGLETALAPPSRISDGSAHFLVGIGGREVAGLSHPHGRWLHWVGDD